MKVHGFEVPEETINAVIARMQEGPFQAGDLIEVVWKFVPVGQYKGKYCGVDANQVAHRIVDRLIQRERSAGNITMGQRPKWKWVVEEAKKREYVKIND